MEDRKYEQDPLQGEITNLIQGAEQLLKDGADDRMYHLWIDDLKSSAHFARSVIGALQQEQHCFDQQAVKDILALNDPVLCGLLPLEDDNFNEGDDCNYYDFSTKDTGIVNHEEHRDELHAFAINLSLLYDKLNSTLTKDKQIGHFLAKSVSILYNYTLTVLKRLLHDDEAVFEQAKYGLCAHFTPLTAGILYFDKDGFAKPL